MRELEKILEEIDRRIDEYVEQTCLTEYNTFDEALAVAESLDPDEINPFQLLLSRFEN